MNLNHANIRRIIIRRNDTPVTKDAPAEIPVGGVFAYTGNQDWESWAVKFGPLGRGHEPHA